MLFVFWVVLVRHRAWATTMPDACSIRAATGQNTCWIRFPLELSCSVGATSNQSPVVCVKRRYGF